MPTGHKNPNSDNSKNHPIYKVFVSSTYRDNEERRKAVQEAITMAGMVWHGMEIFTASTRPTAAKDQRHAGKVGVLVGIIARRCGWIPEGSEVFITEMVYDIDRSAALMNRSM